MRAARPELGSAFLKTISEIPSATPVRAGSLQLSRGRRSGCLNSRLYKIEGSPIASFGEPSRCSVGRARLHFTDILRRLIERGQRNATLVKLMRIATALNRSMADLFAGAEI